MGERPQGIDAALSTLRPAHGLKYSQQPIKTPGQQQTSKRSLMKTLLKDSLVKATLDNRIPEPLLTGAQELRIGNRRWNRVRIEQQKGS